MPSKTLCAPLWVRRVEAAVEVVEVEVEVVVAVAVAYLRRSARLCCRKSRAWASQSLRRRLHSSAHRGMWKRPSLCCSGERNERADGASWCWAGAHVSRGLYPVGLTTRDVTTASGETESRVIDLSDIDGCFSRMRTLPLSLSVLAGRCCSPGTKNTSGSTHTHTHTLTHAHDTRCSGHAKWYRYYAAQPIPILVPAAAPCPP